MLRIAILLVLISVGPEAFAQDPPKGVGGSTTKFMWRDWLSHFFAAEPSYWTIGTGKVDPGAEEGVLEKFKNAKLDFEECRTLCRQSFTVEPLAGDEKSIFALCNRVLACVSQPPSYWATNPRGEPLSPVPRTLDGPDRHISG